jgi:uncharacterized protein (DUF302 family)
MSAALTGKAALDLPMKVLAWEDAQGKVQLSYTFWDEFKSRNRFTGHDELFKRLAGLYESLAKRPPNSDSE